MIVINILYVPHLPLISNKYKNHAQNKMEFRSFLPLYPKFQQSSYFQLQNETDINFSLALDSGDAVSGLKSLHSLKDWDNGFESPRGMDVCLSSALSCAGSGFATGLSRVQGIVLTVHKVEISELINSEWKQAREPDPSRHKKNNSALNDYDKNVHQFL
jgi:hypothetical protein